MTPAIQNDVANEHGRGHVYRAAIQNSFMDFCSGLGEGTDRIADILANPAGEGGEARGRRIGRESIAMVKSIARHIREDMADVSIRGIVCDTSYGLGRLSGKTREMDCRRIFRGVSRTTGKVSGSVAQAEFRSIVQGTSHEMGRLVGFTRNVICARS